ncbi:transketolase C-terminal domain-containing protein [Streptomyces sp. Q6]|uniref:Transketolase C-terminal domain-containing protein n=1 Tax=Streptomyces citrinus TaxID=3118173 RepID=A0ACD5AB84_9ACTN
MILAPHEIRVLPHRRLPLLARQVRAALAARPDGAAARDAVEPALALCRVFDSASDVFVSDGHELALVWHLLTGAPELPGPRSCPHPPSGVRALSYAEGLARALWLAGDTGRRVVVVARAATLSTATGRAALDTLARCPAPVVVLALTDADHTDHAGHAGHAGPVRTSDVLPVVLRRARELLAPGREMEVLGPVDAARGRELEAALVRARDAGRTVVVRCRVDGGSRAVAPASPAWEAVLGDELAAVGAELPEVIAVRVQGELDAGTAPFARRHPERTVTPAGAEPQIAACAAGLAAGRLHPVVVAHDDFAGRALAGCQAGPEHAGVTFALGGSGPVAAVPGVRRAQPRDAARLRAQLREALGVEDAPTLVRFPSGPVGPDIEAQAHDRGVDVLYGVEGGARGDALIVSVGAHARLALAAARVARSRGLTVTVVDPRWADPLPDRVVTLAARHLLVAVVEDGDGAGGVREELARRLAEAGARVPVVAAVPWESEAEALAAVLVAGVGAADSVGA